MVADYEFCKNEEDLARMVVEFSKDISLQRPILGNHPKYFAHLYINGKHFFGLSKFVAFKGITMEAYLTKYRKKVSGGTTQKHIAEVTGKAWTSLSQTDPIVQQSFTTWIHSVFPNYHLSNAYLIKLTLPNNVLIINGNWQISPEELKDRLELQIKMGELGEEIAYKFELQRLVDVGVENPIAAIDHISKKNAAAGYDISSKDRDGRRYIEVKASFSLESPFYLTANEYKTLLEKGGTSYIYRVYIDNLDKRTGYVAEIINDPINTLKASSMFEPILYKVEVIANNRI